MRNGRACWKLTRNALGQNSSRSLHIHLSGIEYGPQGEKEHLPVLESDLDLDALFQALQISAAGGASCAKAQSMEDDALVLQERWAKLAS